jgi:hypothetical protein
VGQAGNLVTKGANLSADKLVQMITGNPQATAPRVLEETSMPFMQAMAPKTPSLLEPTKSDIGFYSQLEAATIPLQNKGTGDQYLAQISKTAGVKPEEIQWTGLDEFLKGKKSVSKDEILNYLNTNRVDVQEVRLGEVSQEQLLAQQQAKNRYREITDAVADTRQKVEEGLLSSQEARAILEPLNAERSRLDNQFFSNAAPATKFSQYTLPGGENYREILLTLPQKIQPEFEYRVYGAFPSKAGFSNVEDAEEYVSKLNQLGSTNENIASEIASAPFRIEKVELPSSAAQNFRSSHFDQPNILAHMRVNDRVVDGKKTLFIEEIQSDWHQAGRKKGYGSKTTYDIMAPDGTWYNQLSERALAEQQAKEIGGVVQEKTLAGVPDAPFKTSWHELSLKRAIQEASEKGYDQIAFTTGKTQAERYDLSKQVRSIDWQESDRRGATKLISIEPYEGNTIELPIDSNGVVLPSTGSQFDGKRVDEVVGKEVAEKIMGGNNGSLSGSGLQVGGEGMKGFYDNILPKSLDKLAKKFDAKVGKAEMDGVEVWQMDITPKMRESVTTKGQPLFAVPAVGAGLLGASMMQNEEMF